MPGMTADDAAAFLGPAPAAPPAGAPMTAADADTFLGPAPAPTNPPVYGSDEAMDKYLAASPVNRVLEAFGQGAKQAWGTANLGLDPVTENSLKKAGIFNDVAKGQTGILRSFNEALIRPGAAALDAIIRGSSAIFRGGQEAVAQAGAEAGLPLLGRDIAAMPEAFAGTPGAFALPHLPIDLPAARDMGVVGEPEAVWEGTAEPTTPAPEAAAADAAHVAKQTPEAAEAAPATPAATMAPEEGVAAPPEAAPTDIHGVARQIAPQTFDEYDALTVHQDNLRQQIADAQAELQRNAEAQAPHSAEIADLEARMQDTTPRLAKKYQARLDTMIPERDAFLNDEFTMGALTRETPEIAALRQQLLETDYRMRDLAPDVTAAYREAAAQMPETQPVETPQPEVAPEAPEMAPQAPEVMPAAAEAPEAAQPTEEQPIVPVAAAGPLPAELRPAVNIVDDVQRQLAAAGRPADEAEAAAQIVAAHYETRAARFEGRKGTAQEMYAREAPEVRAGRATTKIREPEYAQTVKRGRIRLDDGRAVITLMRDANASTFLHETGHAWLEELMRDAADEQAPAGLVADAAKVRDWLGAKEGETIPTRAHEKFARGFERYMMEGTAPTRALARVFAQFKVWLTQIYETVNRLRAPITPDIRDVFDRLLTTQVDRDVVAPEREFTGSASPASGKSSAVAVTSHLAELHEADLRTTEPSDAAPVADHIRQEIDRTVEKQEPEVEDEFKTRHGSESGPGGNAEAVANPPEDGGTAGTIPGTGASPEQLGEVNAGGSGAAANGNRLRGRGNAPRSEPPASGNAVFAAPDSDFIDKAGNIRLDNLNQPEDVNAVIREAAAQNEEFMGDRRGVVSDAQVLSLADDLGMTPAELSKRQLGEAFNAEQVVAARKLLIQSATAVRDAMVKAANGTDADVLAYAAAKDRHIMIQAQVSGITAEAGRALRAFRALEGHADAKMIGEFLQSQTGRTLFQMRREAQMGALLETPAQVSKFVRDSEKPSFGDMLLEYWINGLISGPATHTTYAIGNALLAIFKGGPETLAAAAIGRVRTAFGDEAERVYAGEAAASLYAVLKGQRDGVRAAWKAAKTGLTTELPGETEGAAQGSMLALQTAHGAIPGKLGTIARLPSRGVGVIHSYFRAIGYEQGIAQLAYRQAASEGLTGDAFAARVAALTTNPSADMMEAARTAATEQTLMGQGSELTQAVSRLTNVRVELPGLGSTQILKFVDPFVKIGANIMNQALLERSPLGVLSSEVRGNLMGRNGAVARDQQIARIAVGSALGAVTIGLAAQGFITGGGPSDPKEAAVWRMTGKQPYSIRIGDTWYAMHRLGPLAMVMGVAADMYEFGQNMEDHDVSHMGGLLVSSLAKNLLAESFMRGPSELIQALEDPDRYGPTYVRDFVASFVPFSVGVAQMARASDPYAREARTMMDRIKQGVPWLSQTLLPRYDIWGQPIPNKDALGVAGLTAIMESRVNNDPVNQALLRLNYFPAAPKRQIVGIQLTDQQYADYSRVAGRMAKMRLDQMVNSPGFSALPPGIQVKAIAETISSARRGAQELIKMQNPEIIRQAVQNKRNLLMQGRPAP